VHRWVFPGSHFYQGLHEAKIALEESTSLHLRPGGVEEKGNKRELPGEFFNYLAKILQEVSRFATSRRENHDFKLNLKRTIKLKVQQT
jgi:hypothetical protein